MGKKDSRYLMKIKNCPNCGSRRVMAWRVCGRWKRYYIECDNCHWCGPTRLFHRRAVRAWNREVKE